MVRNDELLSLALAAMDALHLLTDERFQTLDLMWENREALGDEIAAIIVTKSSEDWLQVFEEFQVPVNRVALVDEAVADAQMAANNMIIDGAPEGGVPRLITHPIQISSVNRRSPVHAPDLGEHTEDCLLYTSPSPRDRTRSRMPSSA